MWYVILLAVCIGGDQLLKWWVTSHLDVGQSAPLLPGIVRLTRLHNTGAAWSSFSGKTGLLAAVTIVLMAAVVYLVVKKIVRHPLGLTSAMLVLGGGAGNMIDRLCRGYVVDMFDLEFMSYPMGPGGQKGRAVQKVQGHHIRRVRDGGEVHHLVFLQQPPAVKPQPLHRLRRVGHPQPGQPPAQEVSLLLCHCFHLKTP